MIAEHTRLSPRTFSGFSATMLALGLLSVGFGAVDLAMAAPLGAHQVAAIGLGDSVVVLVLAFGSGVLDIFTSRLAQAEGSGQTDRRLLVLLGGFLLLLVPFEVLAVLVALGLPPILGALGLDDALVSPASEYTAARLLGIAVTLSMTTTMEILKVCGMRGWAVRSLVTGLGLNALFNWVYLYGPAAHWFPSPAAAVGVATVTAQVLMALLGAVALVRGLAGRPERFVRPPGRETVAEAISIGRTGSGVGVRHLNDYVGSTVPLMMIGTLGVGPLAAATVATRIWTIYCRIPQACFTTSFIFYSYSMSRSQPDADADRAHLFRMSALPTLVGALLLVAASPWLITLLGGPEADVRVTMGLVAAYFVGLLPYFFAAFYGELLTVHQKGRFLSVASTAVTYTLVVPLAAVAVFGFGSAFWAVVSMTATAIPTAVLFTRRYFGVAQRTTAPAVAELS